MKRQLRITSDHFMSGGLIYVSAGEFELQFETIVYSVHSGYNKLMWVRNWYSYYIDDEDIV